MKLKKLKRRRKMLLSVIEEVREDGVFGGADIEAPSDGRWLNEYATPIMVKALEEELHRVEERIERYKEAMNAAENAATDEGAAPVGHIGTSVLSKG